MFLMQMLPIWDIQTHKRICDFSCIFAFYILRRPLMTVKLFCAFTEMIFCLTRSIRPRLPFLPLHCAMSELTSPSLFFLLLWVSSHAMPAYTIFLWLVQQFGQWWWWLLSSWWFNWEAARGNLSPIHKVLNLGYITIDQYVIKKTQCVSC